MTIAMKIKELRKRNLLSAEQLADRLGVTKAAYYAYEKGTYNVPLEKIKVLAEIFKVSISEIIDSDNTSKENNEKGSFNLWKEEAFTAVKEENKAVKEENRLLKAMLFTVKPELQEAYKNFLEAPEAQARIISMQSYNLAA